MRAHVAVPGSKSETNRALLLAALADAPSRILGGLSSRDADLMRAALAAFGVRVEVDQDAWLVTPPAQLTAPQAPVECGLAGTVMRFVPPLAALVPGATVRFTGDPEASHRPMAPVLDGLRQLGCTADADGLPFTLEVPDALGGPRVEIDSSGSSQFVSALLLCAARFPHGIEVSHTGASMPSIPPIDMSVHMLRERGVDAERTDERSWRVRPGRVAALDSRIEPDLTGASVFLGAAALTGGEVTILGWPRRTTQSGALMRDVLMLMGVPTQWSAEGLTTLPNDGLRGTTLDLRDAADLTPVVATLAVFAEGETTITGVAHIRGHETDRLKALSTEFTELGAEVTETADGLHIVGTGRQGRGLHGGTFGCYADHRMAHAGALAGLVVDGVVLDDVACTAKTMPDFPQMWHHLLGEAGA